MKRIGFIDYYLSEWHANNYPNWLRAIFRETGADMEIAYAWAETDVSPRDGVTTDEWCGKFGVTRCDTVDELCEKSDCILILAPSDPEKHLAYAEVALKYGKPTYIDKTFAQNLEVAERILSLAKEYGTPMFSTSALRYAEELALHCGNDNFLLTGGGSNLDEYIIHLVEMAVILLDSPVKTVKASAQGIERFFSLEAENGKHATLIYAPSLPYMITSETPEKTAVTKSVKSPFFDRLMRAIADFYESGTLPFDTRETVEAMRMRDMILDADKGLI